MRDEFFTAQRKQTISAIADLFHEAGESIQKNTNISPMIRRHPWYSLAAATVCGLATGYLLSPSKRSAKAHPKPHHHATIDIIQRQLLSAINPILGIFATGAASSIFHHTRGHNGHSADATTEHATHA